MNKIYNLACQAGLITFESLHDSMCVAPSIESVAKAQKFADLLIKECIKIVLDHDPLYGSSIDQDIERLLGVKE
jgi:hypothetical protein